MTGSSVFDYIHQADHAEVAEHLGLSLTSGTGMASPASGGGSDEGSGSQGTNNPDGKFFIIKYIKIFPRTAMKEFIIFFVIDSLLSVIHKKRKRKKIK